MLEFYGIIRGVILCYPDVRDTREDKFFHITIDIGADEDELDKANKKIKDFLNTYSSDIFCNKIGLC